MSTAATAAVAAAQHLTELAGWGAHLRSRAILRVPECEAEVGAQLDHAGSIARGLGRSYGDPALNAGRQVLGMNKLDRYLAFDEASGLLSCEAGVSLARIIRDFAPRGFFPMITPGTKYVTVGGCIASDVHGKAHHAQGSFSECVESLRMLLASGEVVVVSRSENAELFWATVGGMGLLGVILSATIRLRKIESTYFRQHAVRVASLEEMLAALDEYDSKFPYSVAYVDPIAKGARLGSGVLTVGDHATRGELPAGLAKRPLRVSGETFAKVPFELPELTLNPLTIRMLNMLLTRVQAHGAPFSHYQMFFYPLDAIDCWNRGYGRRGFAQYQFVIPFADGLPRLRELLTTIVSSGELPFLNVLKRLGKESGGLLSFPREGYTFAIDFPIRANTAALLRRLDAMVLEAGGRLYLGKDAHLDPATFRAMYSNVESFLAIKAKYDPAGVFVSDLGRRLRLV